MEFFEKVFTWFAQLSAKLPSVDLKTYFIIVLVVIAGVGLIIGLTTLGSPSFKMRSACRKILKYLSSVDAIDDDNVEDFTSKCFSTQAPQSLRDSWVEYLGVRFGYPSDIVSEHNVFDKQVKKGGSVRAKVFIGIALILIALFAFWGFGVLQSNEMSVIHCFGLLLSGVIYLVLVVVARAEYKKSLETFFTMQEELDAKVILQVEKNYATDASPLNELSAMVEEIVARNTAKIVEISDEMNSASDDELLEEVEDAEFAEPEKITPIESLIAGEDVVDDELVVESEFTETQTSNDEIPVGDAELSDENDVDVEDDVDVIEQELYQEDEALEQEEEQIDAVDDAEAVEEGEEVVEAVVPDDEIAQEDVADELEEIITDDEPVEDENFEEDADMVDASYEEGEEPVEEDLSQSDDLEETADDSLAAADGEENETEDYALADDESDITDEITEEAVEEVDEEAVEEVDEIVNEEDATHEENFEEQSEDDIPESEEQPLEVAEDEDAEDTIQDENLSQEEEINSEDDEEMFGKRKAQAAALAAQPTEEQKEQFIDSEVISEDNEFVESEILTDEEMAQAPLEEDIPAHIVEEPSEEVTEEIAEDEQELELVEEESDEQEAQEELEEEQEEELLEESAEEEEVAEEIAEDDAEEAVEEVVEDDAEETADESSEEPEEEVVYVVDGPEEDDEVAKPAKLVKLPHLVDYMIAQNMSKSMKIKVAYLLISAYNAYKNSPENKAIVIRCMVKLMKSFQN